MESIEIYTDGGCKKNGSKDSEGAYCYIVVRNGEIIKEFVEYKKEITNNVMELTAVLFAVLEAQNHNNSVIYSDSRYAIDCVTIWGMNWEKMGWKRNKSGTKEIKNLDLIKEIYYLLKKSDCELQWVKGHSINKFNNRCDELCTMAMSN